MLPHTRRVFEPVGVNRRGGHSRAPQAPDHGWQGCGFSVHATRSELSRSRSPARFLSWEVVGEGTLEARAGAGDCRGSSAASDMLKGSDQRAQHMVEMVRIAPLAAIELMGNLVSD